MPALNSFLNIDLDNHQDVFLFCNFDSDKKLHVVLLDVNKCQAFNGYATDIELRSQAASINMIFSDFLTLSTKALTIKEVEGSKFLYCLERNCESFKFKWKSIDHEETIITIGCVNVVKGDYNALMKDVFSKLSKEFTNLNSKVSTMENEMMSIREEKEDAVRLASEITDMKDRVEKELFSKFILVLNQKKEKIKSLKRCHNDTSVSIAACKKTKITKSKKSHQISDSSDEAVSDMEKVDIAGPSTSKHNISLPFLDDDDNERPILPSPSKRRIRQNNSAVKKASTVEQKCKQKPKITVESESEDELLLNL